MQTTEQNPQSTIKPKVAKALPVKINYNVNQKNKQIKILQYYKRSFKSQLAPAREIQRHKRTRKQTPSSTPGKLTKVQIEKDMDKEKSTQKEKANEKEKESQIKKDDASKAKTDDHKRIDDEDKQKIEKHETTTKPHQKGGDVENQIVNMD